jgi:hypothetical protein
LAREENLGRVDRTARVRRRLTAVRLLLPAGWLLAAVGYFGPWIAHSTAALTLSGVDMGEFVKFLPGVLDGSLQLTRQLLYLPPLALVVSVALLSGSDRLRYPGLLQAAFLVLAVPVSLQLLPPAWSPASLVTEEFRAQTLALAISWLLLAGFWLWGHLPSWLTGSLSALIALAALGLAAWQFALAKPAIDEVYGIAPSTGWGLWVCVAGLAITVTASVLLVVRSREAWIGG